MLLLVEPYPHHGVRNKGPGADLMRREVVTGSPAFCLLQKPDGKRRKGSTAWTSHTPGLAMVLGWHAPTYDLLVTGELSLNNMA